MASALKWIVKEAKRLKAAYPRRFKKWTDYVAQASAIYARKHKGRSPVGKKKRKISSVKFIEKGETKRTKPKRVVKVTRTKRGTFKKFATVGNISDQWRFHNNKIFLEKINKANNDLREAEYCLYKLKNDLKNAPADKKHFVRKTIKDQQKVVSAIKKEIHNARMHLK